jgi:hypothetical protein
MALPSNFDAELGDVPPTALSHTQSKLDSFVKSTSKWTKEGLLDHIIEFVVSEDQVSHMILYQGITKMYIGFFSG